MKKPRAMNGRAECVRMSRRSLTVAVRLGGEHNSESCAAPGIAGGTPSHQKNLFLQTYLCHLRDGRQGCLPHNSSAAREPLPPE